jgi:spermidine/putrescine transport system ATP-binding protein
VKVLLRPEDIQVTIDEEWTNEGPSMTGSVEEVIYKGKTVDLIIKLDEGETIFVTQFFNEDQEELVYREGERVHVNWLYGWEVVL